MPTLKLRFPGGRYHATLWGHHVNEGVIEWPPSPWRLLRALIACGFSSQGWTEIPPIAEQLINKLAGVLPSYRLPEASAAHSRHFMPLGALKKGREQTTLVFDTWANVGDGQVSIYWPCELTSEEIALLSQLTSALGYLGRSESWVEAELIAECRFDFTAFPFRDGAHPGRNYEQVALLAAVAPDEYLSWRKETTTQILTTITLPESTRKLSAKQLAKYDAERVQAVSPYPSDLLACLVKDTVWWKRRGWSRPPGSQQVLYWRRSDSLQICVPQPSKPHRPAMLTTMLLSLSTSSGRRSALPPVSRTLPQAELFHRAVVGRVGNGFRVDCPELTGKDEHNRPRRDHDHTHTIPLDLDADGHLDHLLIYARMGLRAHAQRAVRSVREMWTKGGAGNLQIAVVGQGELSVLRQLRHPFNNQVERVLGPAEGARVWENLTPFVLPRFLKRSDKNSLLGQINAELISHRLPAAETATIDPRLTQELRHYVRRRIHGGTPPNRDEGYGIRLEFAEPVVGPILLGYASHYGLGLFAAVDD